jgi:hypothetical protein
MASYFVASIAGSDGAHAVHDRSRCPPGCFRLEAPTEYLGEFIEATQALAVARLRYRPARRCLHDAVSVAPRVAAPPERALALTLLPP